MTAHIFLLGFMGCGKSHLGERLAAQLGCAFFDLDQVVEAGEGKNIPAIFTELSEPGFRALERKYLHTLENQAPAVIATGGGTPCFFDNMVWMNAHGTTVYLETPVETLYERLRRDRAGRPLLAGLSDAELRVFIETKLKEREPWYRQAAVVATGETVLSIRQWIGG